MKFLDPAQKRRDGTQPYYPNGTGPFFLSRKMKRERWFALPVATRNYLIRKHAEPSG